MGEIAEVGGSVASGACVEVSVGTTALGNGPGDLAGLLASVEEPGRAMASTLALQSGISEVIFSMGSNPSSGRKATARQSSGAKARVLDYTRIRRKNYVL